MPTFRSALRPALLSFAFVLATGLAALAAMARAADEVAVDIPYDTFTLPNGLRVVVHTDRKAPIVAVNVWYHVGSKDEPAGRSGFAHLFEHLMFQRSEHHDGEFFEPFTAVGATDQNGTTNADRTNYFQNVPTTALDMALWMESDRMGHLLGAIDQAALDQQRGVVQNEKRQRENQPYGQVWERLTRALYPKDHPYGHSVIGSMNDLDAASLDDVRQWFHAWYGPNNAVLVLAGDIDLATAKEKVARYFGHIPAGPTMARPPVDVARRAHSTREVMHDTVPQPRIYRAWNVPETGNPELQHLQLLAYLLGGARSSRLDSRLLHGDRLVDGVSASVSPGQLGSNFYIVATVKEGVDPAQVEAVIDEELARLVGEGPTAEELERARTTIRAGFIRGIERIGGFGGKADVLAECTVFHGDPGCFREQLATLSSATADDVRRAGARWLGEGSHTIVVEPGERTPLPEEPAARPEPFELPAPDPKYSTLPPAVDRSLGVPRTTQFPELKFPALQRARLSNGSTVILAERHEVPVVQLAYVFDGGHATDPADRAGTAEFAMGLLDEGAAGLGPLEFARRAELLGLGLGASASQDGASAWASALRENLDPSLALFADMVRRPNFDPAEIERVRATWIAGIRQQKARPAGMAGRVLPGLLYGPDHPYGRLGSGTEASIAALGREDLLAYHRRWVRPEGATVIVVGDTTLAEIVPLLERHFGDWAGEDQPPAPVELPQVPLPPAPRVFLIDQPGAVQANIFAGHLVPSSTDPGAVRLELANGVLGGDFTARLNMNLREDKHWSYGAHSSLGGALGQRRWLVSAPVQIDRTGEAMAEIQREVADFANGRRPPTEAEVARAKAIQTRTLPGAYETAWSVLGTISGIVRYGRPDDYVFRRKAEVEAATPAEVADAARTLRPEALTWVVVGDLALTEAPVRELALGEVQVIDADGKPVAR
ncbi:M16 family metallopeptidase [Luteimonas wenzhouensis]|jgi:zinc protease|uniref:Insulinase family protein n=1 Tax=Luteimonas wenzhouensis TaxID=2599615 RepID=A0A5C5TZE6_9GAMM|nr:insulinase family protein [Xanthomonadaceae bacterium]TWT18758.1 insulinase family protein [Luteimonas wenzhouensis]